MNFRARIRTMSVAQLIALSIGIVYLGLGVAGLFVTGFGAFTRSPDNTVLIFGVSTLLNLLHLFFGGYALLAARSSSGARVFSWTSMLFFAALLTYGVLATLVAAPSEPLNTNPPDNLLHLVTFLAAMSIQVFGTRADRPLVRDGQATQANAGS